MKRITKLFFAAMIAVAAFASCTKDPAKEPDKTDPSKDPENKPEAVAPIIVNVVMPTEANALPGTDVTIQGVGFMEGDVIDCEGKEGQPSFKPTVKSVSNTGIVIAIPEDASGYYIVKVTRNGKTTTLDKELFIPKVNKIENVVVPTGVLHWGDKLTITGDGILATDVVIIESPNYDDIEMKDVAAEGKVEFEIPVTLIGDNTLKIKREDGLTVLGTVKIGAVAYTKALGGVVFYVSDEGLHGLVVHPECVTPAETLWGPSIPVDPYFANTENGIYKGAANTVKLVEQYNKVIEDGTFTYEAKSPAVICSELEVGGYSDWFLPTIDEYTQLYKIKATLAEKELFTIPANNYWTSVEYMVDGPSWVWAMYYHNFYETDPESVVFGPAGVDVWKIGTIAMRMF